MHPKMERPRGRRKLGIPVGTFARASHSSEERLEWKEPDKHWLLCLVGGALVMLLGAGLAALCVFLVLRAGTVFAQLFILCAIGPIAAVFILAALDLWFMRRLVILDRSLGMYRKTTHIAGMQFKESVHSIEDVESVCVKYFTVTKSIYALLQLKKREGDPIFIEKLCNKEDMDALPVKLAEFLDVPIEYAKLTPKEAAHEYRLVKRFFALAYAMLALFFADFAFEFTVPVVRDVLALNRYRAEDLVETPCRILSFEVHHPRKPDSVHATDGGVEVRITEGTQVNVRFEYTYNGTRYESTRYGPLGSSAADNVTAYPPGHETVCYLNPNWPADAVLITEARARPILLAVLVQLVIMPLFLGLAISMQLSLRKHYLKDMAWPGDQVLSAQGTSVT
ncbi:MAG: DUF3592 domain-containing protein [FCB group bacterium]|nr:DUF3592 domain-containing protein [FCB group bacterium]